MALNAAQTFVAAVKRKTGLLSVVEIPDRPAVRVVALVAGFAKHRFVSVVITMAADAIPWRVPECGRDMAFFAGGCGVETQQGEVRYIVIEYDVLAPSSGTVATRALLAFLTLVYIIVAVTVDAVTRQFFTGQVAAMAC